MTIGTPSRRWRRTEALPAVDVHRDEDRLDEEREAFDAECDPEDVAEGRHEVRPQQTHLKDRIVPLTTPAANRISMAFDQRLAIALYGGSPVRSHSPSPNRTSAGNAIPKHTSGM
jgi:hypothetical protein